MSPCACSPGPRALSIKWNVDIGDKVKKGQVLATIFAPELNQEWETKKALVELDKERIDQALKMMPDIKSAQAKLAEAKAHPGGTRCRRRRWAIRATLFQEEVKRGVVNPMVLLEVENQLASSRAERERAKAAIDRAEAEVLSRMAAKIRKESAVKVARAKLKVSESEAKRLGLLVDYLTIRAPIDGIVRQRGCNVGDFVRAADNRKDDDPLFTIERIDMLRVTVLIPEREALFVQDGTLAEVVANGPGARNGRPRFRGGPGPWIRKPAHASRDRSAEPNRTDLSRHGLQRHHFLRQSERVKVAKE